MLFAGTLHAQPSFQSSLMISGQKIYKDVKNTNLYYFIPFDYVLVKDADGKPAFNAYANPLNRNKNNRTSRKKKKY